MNKQGIPDTNNTMQLRIPPNPPLEIVRIQSTNKYDYIAKAIILGEAGVGKS